MRDKRIELSQNDVQRERMTREYGQLREMLHALVMDVEVGAAGTPENDPTALEAQPNGLAPVAVARESMAPAAEAARESKSWRKPAEAGAAKIGTGAEELRAGLKRMLQKNRPPAAELESVQADGTEAPAPAE